MSQALRDAINQLVLAVASGDSYAQDLAWGAIHAAHGAEIAAIEEMARQYAGNYEPGSDGFNTFRIFADWVGSREWN